MQYTIEIFHDTSGENPLLNTPGLRLVSFHPRIGDHDGFRDARDVIIHASMQSGHAVKVWMKERGAQVYVTSPTNPFGGRDDSYFFGFLLFGREYVTEVMGWQRLYPSRQWHLDHTAMKLMRKYTAWLNGWSYGYVVKDDEGNEKQRVSGFLDAADAQAEAEEVVAQLYLKAVG